ncbi:MULTISPECIES: FAD-dependent oxidoreductase [Microbacterium]|nr:MULTISPECIES: FAD-dependent oxidoreductase [unclassified Microbacterium]KQS01127.1 pyridine nucleotide-disulfide oxidoreductase [Microbacterium sp. Leaf347]MBN9199087.1 FAD-dependent oxidoreductase [Microbacterium ginsengisoli]OJU74984.1 MAG: pyridine nucleotide-disulfide oxidoreductase [Microbacterium sp. 71-23]
MRESGAPHRLVIVGGVAGGMSAAARARRLDERAEIVVLERGAYVSFANCGLPYFVGGEIADENSLLVQTPSSLRAALALDVRTGHDVLGLDITRRVVSVRTIDGDYEIAYDDLILAPGARPVRPPIPGLDSPRVRTLRSVDDATSLRRTVDRGIRRAVVLGAGFIGIEAAEVIARRGLAVSLVDVASHPLPPLERELAAVVTAELRALGVDLHLGVAADAIEQHDEEDVVILGDGARLAADLVVLSVGVRPDTEVFEAAGVGCERGAIIVDGHGRTTVPNVWAVGDAVLSVDGVTGARRPIALAGPANRVGRLVADAIFRPEHARMLPAPTGTAIVRVGDQVAALTGANRQALDAAEVDYVTLHLHPNQHAGYFPGATQVHLVVHAATSNGRLLGAQAVGRDGVDKRIDVLATAIRAGLSVEDLIDLDLAYSPPFGQAKDPVNLTGMLGENVRTGALRLWYADELAAVLDRALLLDVRTAAEVAAGAVRGAMHIPHTELRGRIEEVRSAAGGRPIRVMCQSGVRSAIAHRVLAQEGFDSASLSGGMLTLRAWWGGEASEILERPEAMQHA